MWIRSQNGENLAKIVNLKIDRTTILGNTKVDEWDIKLGTYKTKERALEVLDEIQSILKPKAIFKTIDKTPKFDDDLVFRPQENFEITPLSNNIVYEMPQE